MTARNTATTAQSTQQQLMRNKLFPNCNMGKRLFSRMKKGLEERKAQKAAQRKRYDSPPRPRHMPHEIHLFQQSNGSPISQVSGATGLDDRILPPTAAMLQATLPSMDSESESMHSSRLLGRSSSSGGSSNPSNVDNMDVDPKRILFAPIQDDWKTKRNERKNYGTRRGVERVVMKGRKSIMFQSAKFEKLVNCVFDLVDVDQSGKICKKELYAGLILVHLKLATYIGPAACRPASREYVEEIFDTLDVDGSGFLCRKEFGVAMTIFCSQIVSRVIVQVCLTMMVVPLLAKYVLEIWNDVLILIQIILAGTRDADLKSSRLWLFLCSMLNFIIPAGMKGILLDVKSQLLHIVPDGAWDVLPLTIISCALSASLIPWMLFQVDDVYNKFAKAKSEGAKKRN